MGNWQKNLNKLKREEKKENYDFLYAWVYRYNLNKMSFPLKYVSRSK